MESTTTGLSGEIDLIDGDGKYWGSYTIEIRGTAQYPDRFPKVFEIGGRIPRMKDWHVNDDGSCCLGITPEEVLYCKKGINLTKFLKEKVLPYFFNQTYRKVEGYYKNGEHSHGVQGLLEYYSGLLKTGDDVLQTVTLMIRIAKGERPDRTSNCFCGRNEKFRKCHRDAYNLLADIGSDNVRKDALIMAVEFKLV